MGKKSKSAIARKKRNRLIFSLCLLFLGGFFAYASIEEFMMTAQLKKEISAYEQELADLDAESEILNKQIENLNNPDYVKRFAKGKFLVSKEGEQIFKLPSGENDD